MGEPVGKRFGLMLNNIKDWSISFGSHVYRIGLEKNEIRLESGISVCLRNFSLDRFLFLYVPLFSLFVVVNYMVILCQVTTFLKQTEVGAKTTLLTIN